jgi:ABC-type glycerol-3-phosphate transport system permease component
MSKKIYFIFVFFIMSLPMYFMVTGSLQNIYGVMKMPPELIPFHPTFENYSNVIGYAWPQILRWVANSLIVFFIVSIGSMLVTIMAAYSFAFYNFKGKKLLWSFLLIGLMLPKISVVIPLFVVMKKIGIPGTLAAVIFPIIYFPMGLFLSRNYFETIPVSLLESARLDGASEFQILFKIVAPMSRPIVTALLLFSGITALQDYMWQSLVLQNSDKYTLLSGLMKEVMRRGSGAGMNINPIGRALAVGVMLLIPLIIIFACANKYFTQSLGGAIKE